MSRVILYTRVSTDEQAERGYSLPEQMRELREHAKREGWEVVEEVVDAGYSRSSLNRPGMNRVRELVAAGDVDAVLAWKRDRYGAAPWPGVLEVEFAAVGCALRSLDDSGEGEDAEFMGGIKDLIAKRELRVMSQRAGMGKRSKAREGKIVGSGPALFGFRYNADRTGYVVDEETMPIVRRIFRAIGAEGSSM
ncbi:MAG: recombinase family protein [Actinomycetota bacterium]|nr:recombinase family protein [Actinomycetota bacterium]